MPGPVVLILGSGANIGAALVKQFLAAGYHVATVSRSAAPIPGATEKRRPLTHIQADLSDPSAVPGVFARLSARGWAAHAASAPAASDPTNPFAVADDDFDRDWNLMVKSPFVAAREAVRAWTAPPSRVVVGLEAMVGGGRGRKGTFIMTGNACPRAVITQTDVPDIPIANIMTLGVAKSGANFWVSNADEVFKEKGIR